jgi:predicted alpha-1,2-mannosidase
MKQVIFFLAIVLILGLGCDSSSSSNNQESFKGSLVDLINPLMGTDSEFSLSNGNTYPAIATPWGMNFWTPTTSDQKDGWTYQYDHHKIRGIKQTHQASPWLNDYGAFALMATTDTLIIKDDDRASWFSHKAEVARPYYYKVYLADYDTEVEVAPTARCAQFRFNFPEAEKAFIILDAYPGGSEVTILPDKKTILGYCRNNRGGVPDNFKNYFVLEFDTEIEAYHSWKDGYELLPDKLSATGDHVGAVVQFKTRTDQQVQVRVGSSFISHEQALLNLQKEIGEDDFEQTKQKAKETWEKELSRVKVTDPDIGQVKTFYSCLYRVLLFPRMFYEINAEEEIVHYSPYNGKVEKGYMFTDNGFWDTFRAVFPFFNLMYPELNNQIMQGLANTYKESGWLPEWAAPGHRGVMIGSNSAINIADAFLKGNARKEVDVLWEAVLKNANVEEGRPESSVGREGLNYYNELGYVPYDVGIRENAARTLEYAFADFNLAKMAEERGDSTAAKRFYRQAENWKNLFDPETRWMRGRNEDGSFQKPFNPLKWGDAFTEGNALHYTWSVFHDIAGLAEKMGGPDSLEKKLDLVFEMPPDFDDSYYGFTIHEIREMQIVNMGNYAHGNQPIQHMIYLYNYAGKGYKAQARLREVMTKLYSATPDGYCGDEDNGQTSAWYVFSAMGFYPVTPGVPQYVIGSPLFDEVEISLPNGKRLSILAENNTAYHPYIQSISWNGDTYLHSFLKFEDLLKGGKLVFQMGNVPNKDWATSIENFPYSLSRDQEVIKKYLK